MGISHQSRQHLHGIFLQSRFDLRGRFFIIAASNDIHDNSSTDISSTTVYQHVGQLYIELLFQQIIIFINCNFYLHYDSFLSIPLPLW